jgi:hypothetical protein
MRISGPERYKLSFDAISFVVECKNGTPNFSGISTSKKPKLYIVSVDGKPIYVGVTRQPIRNRLRFGWSASGANGYHGYAWRHHMKEANIDIWCHDDAATEDSNLEIETVEAEVVFLIRSAGQWPLYQTEIHFHPSTPAHREVAAAVMGTYEMPVAVVDVCSTAGARAAGSNTGQNGI